MLESEAQEEDEVLPLSKSEAVEVTAGDPTGGGVGSGDSLPGGEAAARVGQGVAKRGIGPASR